MKSKKWLFVAVLALTFLSVFAITANYYRKTPARSVSAGNQDALQSFSESDLKKHDGTDPSLPIYLAYEGNVYDVTAGKQYYQPGGTYHFLAGRDSTFELNIAGGGIIKSKYPVVGKLIK